MPTRLYFSTRAAEVVAVPNGVWGDVSEALASLLSEQKVDTPLVIGSRIGPWTAGVTALDRRFVSNPLLGAQTISGTLAMQLMAREYNNGDNSTSRVEAYVVSKDGSTVRGTLLAIGQYGPASEYINNLSHQNKTFITLRAFTLVNALDGDRIVIAVGHSDTGSTPEASCKFGDPIDTADLPIDELQTTNGTGWIEFSGNLLFVPSFTGMAIGADSGNPSGVMSPPAKPKKEGLQGTSAWNRYVEEFPSVFFVPLIPQATIEDLRWKSSYPDILPPRPAAPVVTALSRDLAPSSVAFLPSFPNRLDSIAPTVGQALFWLFAPAEVIPVPDIPLMQTELPVLAPYIVIVGGSSMALDLSSFPLPAPLVWRPAFDDFARAAERAIEFPPIAYIPAAARWGLDKGEVPWLPVWPDFPARDREPLPAAILGQYAFPGDVSAFPPPELSWRPTFIDIAYTFAPLVEPTWHARSYVIPIALPAPTVWLPTFPDFARAFEHSIDELTHFAYKHLAPSWQQYEALLQYDPTKFTSGSVTVYFEAILEVSNGTAYARAWNITDVEAVADSEVSTTSATRVRLRSSALTLPATAKEYRAEVGGSPGATVIIRSARFIIQS